MSGPAPKIVFLKVAAPAFRFLAFDEARALFDAADGEWRPMLLVALRTGVRIGELLALRWKDVDLVNARLMARRTVHRGRMGTTKVVRDRCGRR